MHFPSENDISDRFESSDGRLILERYKQKEYGRSLVNFYQVRSQEDM
jgi:hypothetical protein